MRPHMNYSGRAKNDFTFERSGRRIEATEDCRSNLPRSILEQISQRSDAASQERHRQMKVAYHLIAESPVNALDQRVCPDVTFIAKVWGFTFGAVSGLE